MKLFLLLLSFITLFSITAHTQNPSIINTAPTEKPVITSLSGAQAAKAAHADTIAAVHFLFKSRRNSACVLTGVSLFAAMTFVYISVALQGWGRSEKDYTLPTIAGAAIIGGGPVLLESGKLHRFSTEREKMVIAAYEERNILPIDIRIRLHKRYFN